MKGVFEPLQVAHASAAHKILGVPPTASKKEIKSAYLKAALRLGSHAFSTVVCLWVDLMQLQPYTLCLSVVVSCFK